MDQRLQDSDSRQNPAQTQEEGKLDGPKSKPDARRQWQDDAFSGEKMGCQCGGRAFSSTFDIEQQKNGVMKMGKLQKQRRQSNSCLRFSPREDRLQQSESANVGPQTWRGRAFLVTRCLGTRLCHLSPDWPKSNVFPLSPLEGPEGCSRRATWANRNKAGGCAAGRF